MILNPYQQPDFFCRLFRNITWLKLHLIEEEYLQTEQSRKIGL